MTKTEARQIAAQSLRHGYYHAVDSPDYGVTCARCHGRVTTQRNHAWMPARKGQPYSQVVDGKRCNYQQENITQALTRAMLDHLLSGECQPA